MIWPRDVWNNCAMMKEIEGEKKENNWSKIWWDLISSDVSQKNLLDTFEFHDARKKIEWNSFWEKNEKFLRSDDFEKVQSKFECRVQDILAVK